MLMNNIRLVYQEDCFGDTFGWYFHIPPNQRSQFFENQEIALAALQNGGITWLGTKDMLVRWKSKRYWDC